MVNLISLTQLPPPPAGKTGWPWTEETPIAPKIITDGSTWPHVSIVTPCYNHGQFIEETIRSVLLQGYPNLEYIVIDGGSSDNSVEIIKKYEPWLAYWISEKDRGQSHAINKGFHRATGELAGWINSDDIYFPGAIKTVVAFWLENGKPNSLITGTKLKGNPTLETITRLDQSPYTVQRLIEKNIIEQPSTFYPLGLLKKIGCIDERYRMSMDYDLWLRMVRKGVNISFLDVDLAITRNHPLAKTARFQRRSLTEVLQTVWRNYRIIPEPWLKKFITVWVVPEGLRPGFTRTFFYLVRDILLKLAVIVLGRLDLMEYHPERLSSPGLE